MNFEQIPQTPETRINQINVNNYVDDGLLEKEARLFKNPKTDDHNNTYENLQHSAPDLGRIIGPEKTTALLAAHYEMDEQRLLENERQGLKEEMIQVINYGIYNEIGATAENISKKKAVYGEKLLEGLPIESFKRKLIIAIEDLAVNDSPSFTRAVAASADILDPEQLKSLLDTVPEIKEKIDRDIEKELAIQRDLELGKWDGDPELKPTSNGGNILGVAGNYAKAFGREIILPKLDIPSVKAIETHLEEMAQWGKSHPNQSSVGLLRDAHLLKQLQAA